MEGPAGCRPWRELHPVIADLTACLGHSPNASELAHSLGVSRDEVVDCITAPGWMGAFSRTAPSVDLDLDDLERSLLHAVAPKCTSPLLSALPADERTVVLLRLSAQLSSSEIASRIGMTAPEVYRLLARALASLRNRA